MMHYADVIVNWRLNRRTFLATPAAAWAAAHVPLRYSRSPLSTTESANSREDITHYNNYYEFGTSKDEPVINALNLKTEPWTVEISGEVTKPVTLDIDRILKLAPL